MARRAQRNLSRARGAGKIGDRRNRIADRRSFTWEEMESLNQKPLLFSRWCVAFRHVDYSLSVSIAPTSGKRWFEFLSMHLVDWTSIRVVVRLVNDSLVLHLVSSIDWTSIGARFWLAYDPSPIR